MWSLALALALVASPKATSIVGRVDALRVLRAEHRDKSADTLGASLLQELATASGDKNATTETLVQLGRTQIYMGDNAGAAITLEEAIGRAPEDVSAYLYRGSAAENLGDLLKAEQCFLKVARLAPSDARGWASLGRVLVQLRQHDRGIGALKSALELDPRDSYSLALLGDLLIKLERGEEGIGLLEQAIAVRADPRLVFAAGEYYQDQGKYQLARERFEVVAKRDPDDLPVRESLVQVAQALGDLKARDRWRGEVIKLNRAKHPSASEFCREQFEVAGQSVLAFEFFELSGSRPARYAFRVLSARPGTGVARVIHLVRVDAQTWQLEDEDQGFRALTAEPTYEQTRELVLEVLRK